MKPNSIICLTVEAKPASELSKAIARFIEDRTKARQSLQQEFDKKTEKQIKKIEQGRL